jgi:hypothetical protein
LLKFVVVYFGFGLLRRLPLVSNKVRCESSLARCRRIAVAPNNGEQHVTDDALTAYFVTGLAFMPVMQIVAIGKFNFE